VRTVRDDLLPAAAEGRVADSLLMQLVLAQARERGWPVPLAAQTGAR
jgi:hypothetical protein